MAHRLQLSVVPGELAVCRLAAEASVPPWLPTHGFVSVTRTAEELSIVCDATVVPSPPGPEVRVQAGWRCIRFEGPFAFTETGILLSVLAPLAGAGVGVFVLSTFDTDYVLVPQDALDATVVALEAAGHIVAG